MDLQTLKLKYRKKPASKISEKQKLYLESLQNKHNVTHEQLEQVLDKSFVSYSELTHADCSAIIRYFKSNVIPLSEKQNAWLRSIFGDDMSVISKLCKREITDYDQLFINDIKRLTKYNPSFNFHKFVMNFKMRCNDQAIDCGDGYEYGKQHSEYGVDGWMYYIKFNYLMMLDYDDCEDIQPHISKLLQACPSFILRIYKTYNGYHVFIMSHEFDHYSIQNVLFMNSMGCDPWYAAFAYKNGYRIRLSKKKDRDETYIHQFVDEVCGPEATERLAINDELINRMEKLTEDSTAIC